MSCMRGGTCNVVVIIWRSSLITLTLASKSRVEIKTLSITAYEVTPFMKMRTKPDIIVNCLNWESPKVILNTLTRSMVPVAYPTRLPTVPILLAFELSAFCSICHIERSHPMLTQVAI
jgi:hypothetical protein